MRPVWELLYWGTVALVAYVYLGYPALLWFLNKCRREPRIVPIHGYEPEVSLIIAAHNEEQVIGQKLENTLGLEYPRDKLEIIVASDGSSDMTPDIVRKYRGRKVQLLELACGRGKAAAQNAAVEQARGEVIVFTDADVSLPRESLRQMVTHLGNERIGCVVGRVVYSGEKKTGVGQGEETYWRYELMVRDQESSLGILSMGSGALIGIRRNLFRPLDSGVSEDFVLPMYASMDGYTTVYAPEIFAVTPLSQDGPEELLRSKVRIITLDTRSLLVCRAILNPFRYPLLAWGLISHKILRWLVPYFLIALFCLNLVLMDRPLYQLLLAPQSAFYALAAIGYLWQRKAKAPRFMGIPFSFCLVNLAALVGVARFLMGKTVGRWEPTRPSQVDRETGMNAGMSSV